MNKKHPLLSRRFVVPGALMVVGLLSISILFYYEKHHHHLHELFFVDELIHGIQLNVVTAHLILEEVVEGDPVMDEKEADVKFEQALDSLLTLMRGGDNIEGRKVHAFTDEKSIKIAEELKLLLMQLISASKDKVTSGIEAAKDRHYDEQFSRVFEKTELMRELNETSLRKYEVQVENLFWLIMFIWVPFILMAVLGLAFYEVRRKKAEQQFVESQHFVQHIADTTPNIIFIFDLFEERFLYVNQQIESVLGYTSARLEENGKQWFLDLLHPDDAPLVEYKCDQYTSAGNEDIIEYDCRIQNAEKGWQWFNIKTIVFKRTAEGRPSQILGTAVDMTRIKKAEEELGKYNLQLANLVDERTSELLKTNKHLKKEIINRQKAEAVLKGNSEKYKTLSDQYRDLLESIGDPIILMSPELEVLWANSAAISTFNTDSFDMIGQKCYSLCKNNHCTDCPVAKAFHTGKVESTNLPVSLSMTWHIRGFPINDEHGKVSSVIAIITDITSQIRSQSETIRTGQLAAIGELAAGVAHEINNPINSVINFAQILADQTTEGSKENNAAQLILDEGNRVARIVASLLSFARYDNDEKDPVHIKNILSASLSMIQAQLKKERIHLKEDVPAGLPEINVLFQQMQQVCLNIINNARYSLNQKYVGSDKEKLIKIKGEQVKVKDRLYLRVTFYDNGMGIPQDMLHRIIHPFVTTKPKGKGTGLGLSISYNIINNHGGEFRIESEENEFTKVIVDLPIRKRYSKAGDRINNKYTLTG